MLHPFRVPLRGWPVTQGTAPGFALHSALGYFLLPFQGSGNIQIFRPGVNDPGYNNYREFVQLGPSCVLTL